MTRAAPLRPVIPSEGSSRDRDPEIFGDAAPAAPVAAPERAVAGAGFLPGAREEGALVRLSPAMTVLLGALAAHDDARDLCEEITALAERRAAEVGASQLFRAARERDGAGALVRVVAEGEA